MKDEGGGLEAGCRSSGAGGRGLEVEARREEVIEVIEVSRSHWEWDGPAEGEDRGLLDAVKAL